MVNVRLNMKSVGKLAVLAVFSVAFLMDCTKEYDCELSMDIVFQTPRAAIERVVVYEEPGQGEFASLGDLFKKKKIWDTTAPEDIAKALTKLKVRGEYPPRLTNPTRTFHLLFYSRGLIGYVKILEIDLGGKVYGIIKPLQSETSSVKTNTEIIRWLGGMPSL